MPRPALIRAPAHVPLLPPSFLVLTCPPVLADSGCQATRRAVFVILSCFVAHGLKAQEELPLPQWSAEELRAFRDQNTHQPALEALLPERAELATGLEDLLRGPVKSGPRLDDLPETLTGELQPRLTMDHMRSFLPDSHQSSQEEVRSAHPAHGGVPTAMTALKEVSPEFLKAASGMPGDLFFIDPDSHVPEMAAMEITRLLEFHARDAAIRLYVLVMGKNEKLPGNAPLDEVASGRLLKTNACLVVYPVGEPWRAQLFVSQPVLDVSSQSFFAETAAESVKQAVQASEAHDQLERYVVSLSTRLFWLQKALGKDLRHDAARSALREFPTSPLSPGASTAPPVQPASSASEIPWLLWLVLSGIAAGAGWGSVRWHRNRQQRLKSCVWILPEPETVSRLGGAFCGGGGGMVKFG